MENLIVQKKDGSRNFYLKLSEPIDIDIWKCGNIYCDKMPVSKIIIGGVDEHMLPGGIYESLHIVWKYDDSASIFLAIPIDKIKDIDSAIEKAKNADFKAKVINWNGYKYLQIYKEGYKKDDDQKVVEELKKVAREVSKEYYSHHIRQLRFEEG